MRLSKPLLHIGEVREAIVLCKGIKVDLWICSGSDAGLLDVAVRRSDADGIGRAQLARGLSAQAGVELDRLAWFRVPTTALPRGADGLRLAAGCDRLGKSRLEIIGDHFQFPLRHERH